MLDIDTIWQKITLHAGEPFHMMEGAEFTDKVRGNVLRPNRTNRNIPKSDFGRVLPYHPFSSTTVVNRLGVQGPSYVYAILMDPRILGDTKAT